MTNMLKKYSTCVQQVRVSSFRNDLLQNPYFSYKFLIETRRDKKIQMFVLQKKKKNFNNKKHMKIGRFRIQDWLWTCNEQDIKSVYFISKMFHIKWNAVLIFIILILHVFLVAFLIFSNYS